MVQMIRIWRSDGVAWMDRQQLLKSSLALGGLADRAEAERAVRVMEELFSRFPANPV